MAPGSEDPEDAIENPAVIHPWHAAWLIGQHGLNGGPFRVGEFVAHDSSPRSEGLESWLRRQAHGARANAVGRNGPKADSVCSFRFLPGLTHCGPQADFSF